MHRSEDIEMLGGMSIERISVLAGDTSLGRHAEPRRHGRRACRSSCAGPGGRELNPEQIEQARLRRMRTEFNRYLLAFLGGAKLQPTYVAVAEAPDGKADVLEVKNEAGRPCGSSSISRRTCR